MHITTGFVTGSVVDANDLEKQIQFARHNFDHHQALIRSLDTKAGAMATIMLFLAASAVQVSKDAVGKVHAEPFFVALCSVIFLLAACGLGLSVVWSFYRGAPRSSTSPWGTARFAPEGERADVAGRRALVSEQ